MLCVLDINVTFFDFLYRMRPESTGVRVPTLSELVYCRPILLPNCFVWLENAEDSEG